MVVQSEGVSSMKWPRNTGRFCKQVKFMNFQEEESELLIRGIKGVTTIFRFRLGSTVRLRRWEMMGKLGRRS